MRFLVNNAGATLHIGDLADTPVATIKAVIDVNLLSVILCARRAAQVMSTNRGGAGGAIVNVSSAAATLGSAHEYVHYAAAKAGVDALTVGLAKELAGDGIRVNAVAPGLALTEIHAAAGAPDRARACGGESSPWQGRGCARDRGRHRMVARAGCDVRHGHRPARRGRTLSSVPWMSRRVNRVSLPRTR